MADDDLNRIRDVLNPTLSVEKGHQERRLIYDDGSTERTKMYPALIIVNLEDQKSVVGARRLINSIHQTRSRLLPFMISATVPANLDFYLRSNSLPITMNSWKYPHAGVTKTDLKTGLSLTGYRASNPRKVISCAVSHLRCWELISALGGGVVFEHDAILKRQINPFLLDMHTHGIVGLNDPRGATRKASVYHDAMVNNTPDERVVDTYECDGTKYKIKSAPWVDDRKIPQGLAGNSAYYISNVMAMKMLNLVKEHGLWPNDALMCKQLVPTLKQVYPYMTGLQGIQSTTTG